MALLPNLTQIFYKSLLQPLLFTLNAESAHNAGTCLMKTSAKIPGMLGLMKNQFLVTDPRLNVTLGPIALNNPVGLAAGFDKGAELLHVLPSLGFGFAEVGTFTPLKQEGKDKPRLFRYKTEKALINRMGFNNPGVVIAAERLKRFSPSIPVGINIGKGRDTALEEAADDYLTAIQHLYPFAKYFALNVSSPNTANLRALQQIDSLKTILTAVLEKIRGLNIEREIPVFTKVSPDCNEDLLQEIAKLSLELGTGLIATNTTLDHSSIQSRPDESGGLSGKPIKDKANRALATIFKTTRGKIPLIGVGGIFSAEDAYEKIRLGASAVQIYSGWIYGGPGLVPEINNGLLRFIERDGFKNIQDAVGKN